MWPARACKAGMLVALLVGAIRTAAEFQLRPDVCAGRLNRRLLGRGDAQATCLALTIAADGAATLVNAGPLPPYLNGEPVADGGRAAAGNACRTRLSPRCASNWPEGDRLVLLSDGIAEAMDADGQPLRL